MQLPPELIVTIRRTNPDDKQARPAYLAVTTRANGAEVCSSTFELAEDLLVDLEPQWMLDKAVPRDAYEAVKGDPARGELAQQEIDKLVGYGRRMYGLLFGDGAKLKSFLEYNDAYRRETRLTLAMHGNAAALWRLPWEYLHDGADFLALQGRFLLSRRPDGLAELDPPAAALPLRILVVVSAPDDQRPLDSEEEIAAIQEALDEAVRTGRVEAKYLDDATLDAIGDAVRSFQPHVLHYTGHGKYDDQAGAQLSGAGDRGGQDQARRHRRAAPAPAGRPRAAAGGALRLPDRPDQRRGRVQRRGHRPAASRRAGRAGHAVLDPRRFGHPPGPGLLRQPGARRQREPGRAARPHRPARFRGRPRLRLGRARALPAGQGRPAAGGCAGA